MKAGSTRYIELDEVIKSCVMETFEDETGHLKVYSLSDGKPAKFVEQRASRFMLVRGK